MEISSRQFHLGKFGHTQKGANGSLVRTALNNEVQSPGVSVHVSLFCTPIWPRWRHVKTIYNPLSFFLCFKLLLPSVAALFKVVLATVDVTFVVFAFIVVSGSVVTVVTVLGVTYSLPAKESHFLVFLNNLIYTLSNGLKIILSSFNIFFLERNAIGINRDINVCHDKIGKKKNKKQWDSSTQFREQLPLIEASLVVKRSLVAACLKFLAGWNATDLWSIMVVFSSVSALKTFKGEFSRSFQAGEARTVENHGYQNLVIYASKKFWLWQNRPPIPPSVRLPHAK